MQNVSCPGCGAQVQFKSSASVMAVCEFCKATVLKDADSVKNLGKMSDVLADYSPIQIGTSGAFGSQGFTVIGRIQLRYTDGIWNEWYILFDDGHPSWLSDASGQYTLTTQREIKQQLPSFSTLAPAQLHDIAGERYTASDVRVAECIGGQGELPFTVGKGWQAKVADFRSGTHFLTLDYSDAETPTVYTGLSVALEDLKCQLLRDDDVVKDSTEKFKGKIDRLGCPACGSNVSYLPGLTTHIVCPSCHAQVDTSTKVAQVLEAGNRMAAVVTTLELGARATIAGQQFELIGLMRRRDDEGTPWTEYLMYNPRGGFLWLVETNEGWSRAKVLDGWPVWDLGSSAMLDGRSYRKLYDYLTAIEFEDASNKLAAEISAEEFTWSLSTPVSADQIRAWFGKEIKADKEAPEEDLNGMAVKFMIGLALVNLIPLLLAFDDTWLYVALGLGAIYYPAKFLSPRAGEIGNNGDDE
jgi:hypothetical protein